jgi:hypothetical protein
LNSTICSGGIAISIESIDGGSVLLTVYCQLSDP